MQAVFSSSGFLRQGVASVLLCVFIALSMMPVGFMPSFSRDGSVMKICSGLEEKSVTVDIDGHPAHQTIKIPCDFSINTSPVPMVQAVLLPPPVFERVTGHTISVDNALPQTIARAHASRAPPITV